MQLLTPDSFSDYELIDCGAFHKLERFGSYITIRPEPQALWEPSLPMRIWEQQAHVKFIPKSSSSGSWKKLKEMPDRWQIRYDVKDQQLQKQLLMRLSLTSFKHVGIFPEQAVNWDYIYQSIRSFKTTQPKVLNLFAYTGAASLAAHAAGADTTHLDSIRQVVSWARENMELSGLSDIRWVVEDALTFVKREVKRGKKYNGIILDPPAYGHGANGEKWKLEDQLNEMMDLVFTLLDEKESFIVLNTYSLGLSSLVLNNIFNASPFRKNYSSGEIYLQSGQGIQLPLGVFARGCISH